jgi:hypothetical protein
MERNVLILEALLQDIGFPGGKVHDHLAKEAISPSEPRQAMLECDCLVALAETRHRLTGTSRDC